MRLIPLAAATAALLAATPAASAQGIDPNPCLTPQVEQLRCPDFVMKKPFGLYAQRLRGRVLLRAGNSLDNVGDGPAELHGRRVSEYLMRARQRI